MLNRICFLFVIIFTLPAYAVLDPGAYPTYKNYKITSDPKNRVLLHTYSYQQTTGYTCGPAVVMSLLYYYGMLRSSQMNHATEMQIAHEMGTTEGGTSQLSMVDWLQNHGFAVNYGQNVSIEMLINNLNRGIPTIIVWNDWMGHAILVIGYQLKDSSSNGGEDTIFLADPESSSSISEHQISTSGINTLSASDLQFNQFNAQHYFNPSHTAPGMYIVAVPKNR